MHQKLFSHTLTLIKQAYKASSSTEIPTIIVGLSGGPDSVYLLLLLKVLRDQGHINLHAAHLDHGWRETSATDANFCQQLCDQYNIRFTLQHANQLSLPIKYNGSKEEVGRTLRRHFFDQIQRQFPYSLVALGHHLQDQQETFFIRMLRGTTLSGLCSMKAIAGFYIRPLLNTNKADILAYLHENNITFCHDATNDTHDFLRNRIRSLVLPALQTCDQRFNATFTQLINHLQSEDTFLSNLTRIEFDAIFSKQSNDNHQGILAHFNKLDQALQKRVLLYWLIQKKVAFTPTHGFMIEVLRFLANPAGGSHNLGHNWHIIKQRGAFWLEKDT